MVKTYDLTAKAKTDLRNIWNYTEDRWGEQQADRYYRDIIKTIELLAAGKRQGRVSFVRAGYLKYPVGRHLVYFTIENNRIKVVRVLHGNMDVDRHL